MEIGQFELRGKKGTIYDADLDLDRTKRIYSTLNNLSDEAKGFLNSGNLEEFSFAADKMRPMLSYINDNSLLISKHLEHEKEEEGSYRDIRSFASNLTRNLKIIERAQKSMDQISFSPAFFLSKELTNAYLDNQIPLAWEFQHDLIIVLNLDHSRLIDSLLIRGQKRIFLIGGSIETSDYAQKKLDEETVIYRVDDYSKLIDVLTMFKERPPRRVVVLDVGNENTPKEMMDDMKNVIDRGRQAGWLRFNTINRGDAVKVMDNLHNISIHQQTLDFHNKFKGKSAIIVCPGPSLSKNVKVLKKAKGRILIVCVLHAYKALRAEGIEPDIVIHTDPQSLKNLYFEKNGKQVSQWEEWIENNDFSNVQCFITSSSAAPEMYSVKAKKILWMSPGMSIGDFLPIDLFDYTRVGGSVSHSAFDLMVEFGFDAIALVGQDLALADNGEVYSDNAKLDKSKKRLDAFGEVFMAQGWNGKQVKTNNSFSFFGKSYERFAAALKNDPIRLYNCTEGGMYIEGFEHIKLEKFVNENFSSDEAVTIDDILTYTKPSDEQKNILKKRIRQYTVKNMRLASEIRELVNSVLLIGENKKPTDGDLSKFDKLQNKAVKKMKNNQFYELGLQKEMYMLRSGLLADRSLEGQIGFHLDFLKSARKFNNKVLKALSEQFKLINAS